jgi:hypothetical protein
VVANTKCFWSILYTTPLVATVSGSSCNQCTLRVANKLTPDTVFRFSCNLTVVRVAINVHFELQIPSASAWYYTTPSVINVHSELEILSASAWYILPLQSSVATRQRFELQLTYTPSCKYWMLLPNTVLPYPFSCNRTMVRVAIDIHSKLQILSASAWY